MATCLQIKETNDQIFLRFKQNINMKLTIQWFVLKLTKI